uniref:Uncharacterized protein n=1 Tax=Panagrolaimus sp. PS1159 TaxID=55785 RepID=A0AC35FZ36_9BILA
MATKDNCLFLKDKFSGNNNSNISDNGDQYLNLNLNQNQKYSNFSPIQSNSKLNNDKFCDSTIFDNREDKRNLQTWNKSSDSRFITLNDKTEGVKKNWKKNDSLNFKNNSTFSLHISAYENSTEATVFDDSFNENDKKVLIKEKSSFGSTFVIQNPFEFPRQQNDNVSEPEMSQFRASQRLLNPNEASNNDQQMINRSLPQSYTEFRNRNRESTVGNFVTF